MHALTRLCRFATTCLLAALVLTASTAAAITPPSVQPGAVNVKLQTVATGFDSFPGELLPIDMSPFPDGSGRILVGTFGGVLRVVDPLSGLLPQPYMTHTQTNNTVIGVDGDHGLTSVEFHPDFASPDAPGYGKFYTITAEPAGSGVAEFGAGAHHQNVIREWDMASGGNSISSNMFSGVTADSREVLRFNQPGPFHNVSDLAFDSEAYLHIAVGDGGAGPASAQDVTSAFGSVLKIDPLSPLATDGSRGASGANGQYRIPGDNPFVGAAGLDEVWAYGLRSPYRMNFDSLNGDLWIGDVGGGSREEVDLVRRGENHGWPQYEGTNGVSDPGSIPGFTFPVLEYTRDEGVTVIGGFVYRGDAIPALQGKYVFAELGQNHPTSRLFYGSVDPQAADYGVIYEFPLDSTGAQFPGNQPGTTNPLPDRIISIGQDLAGELYVLAGQDPRTHTPSAPGGFLIRLDPATFLLGDLNGDGAPFQIDDFRDVMLPNLISTHPGLTPAETVLLGDFDGNLTIDAEDFRFFKQQHIALGGSAADFVVPEPCSATLFALVLLFGSVQRATASKQGVLANCACH